MIPSFIKKQAKALKLIKGEHHKHCDGDIIIELNHYSDEMKISIPSYVFGKIEQVFTIKSGFMFLEQYYAKAIKVAKQYKKDGYVKKDALTHLWKGPGSEIK